MQRLLFLSTVGALLLPAAHGPGAYAAELRAGAAAVDITPHRFPVIVNGYFRERTASVAHDRLKSRALVLDDGNTRIAIVVVDSLMLPRALLDRVKEAASAQSGTPTSRILIAATHTHSAPSAMACLGSREDPRYVRFLEPRIVASIVEASRRLEPARLGWAVVEVPELNHCRRWILRPDRIGTDPFGQRTVRANMHPGYRSPNHIGPSGPADHQMTLLSIQARDGRPIAVLANLAFHYFGRPPVSGDVCGQFGPRLAEKLRAVGLEPPFVGMLSQGTSGDSMWMDYSQPGPAFDFGTYLSAVVEAAARAYQSITYRDAVSLAMAETTLRLRRRTPDERRWAWAQEVLKKLGERPPRSMAEIYAREAHYLRQEPERELKLQAIRIGNMGITAIPNEVYGITGIKIKLRSPLQPTMNIELANGAEGYIPPPEQHRLGGYTTWPARTAGLEVQAEPRVVETLLRLLEQVSGKPRRAWREPDCPYARNVMKRSPLAYFRLGELSGPVAHDMTGRHNGTIEGNVAYYLPGPDRPDLKGGPWGNRGIQFVGGRIVVPLDRLPTSYTLDFWFWNGLPSDVRPVTAYLISVGDPKDPTVEGLHLGIGGTHEDVPPGRLFVYSGDRSRKILVGKTSLELRRWYHVRLVRTRELVQVYLEEARKPELQGKLPSLPAAQDVALVLGSRCDGFAPLEGRLDEVAIFAP